MDIRNLKIEVIHTNYDPESPVHYTKGVLITFIESGRWDRKIVIHEDEYENQGVIGIKLHDFTQDNLGFLRGEIKKEIYKRLRKSFDENADCYDPNITNVMDDIKALRFVHDEIGYLDYLSLPVWFEELKDKK